MIDFLLLIVVVAYAFLAFWTYRSDRGQRSGITFQQMKARHHDRRL